MEFGTEKIVRGMNLNDFHLYLISPVVKGSGIRELEGPEPVLRAG